MFLMEKIDFIKKNITYTKKSQLRPNLFGCQKAHVLTQIDI